jgi:hypothetical protein
MKTKAPGLRTDRSGHGQLILRPLQVRRIDGSGLSTQQAARRRQAAFAT